MSNNVLSYSTIDHFVASTGVYNIITEAGVVHSGANPSNHSPIFAKLAVGFDPLVEPTRSQPRSSWEKANTDAREEFKKVLGTKLRGLDIPEDCLSCRDIHCKAHTECLEEYTVNVLELIESAGKETLPCVGQIPMHTKNLH